jgi:hypothetical protein
LNGQDPETFEPPPAPSPQGTVPPTGQEFLYPAFMAAICAGVLSGVPLLNLGCLIWIVGGGMLAVYFFEQKHGRPLVRLADGARLGMITGFFGFFFYFFVNMLSQLLIMRGPRGVLEAYRQVIEKYPMPPGPEAEQLKAFASTPGGMAVLLVIGAIFSFIAFVLLSTAGGALGVRAFRKDRT